MNELIEILKNLDWSPLYISIKTAAVATAISFILGIQLARKMLFCRSRKKALIDGIMSLPMVLPPTVAGFILLIIFSKNRPLGIWLNDELNISIIQTWAGCIIAATIISFPLMYQNARAAFDQVDKNIIYSARTLGLSERIIFYKVLVPSSRPGLVAGSILCFARAMGEYGATSMIAGNIQGKTNTISQTIAMVINDGNYMKAGIWVLIVLLISFAIIFGINVLTTKE